MGLKRQLQAFLFLRIQDYTGPSTDMPKRDKPLARQAQMTPGYTLPEPHFQAWHRSCFCNLRLRKRLVD